MRETLKQRTGVLAQNVILGHHWERTFHCCVKTRKESYLLREIRKQGAELSWLYSTRRMRSFYSREVPDKNEEADESEESYDTS